MKIAGAGAGETVARADQCLDSARNKYETAAMHGWAGLAGNLEVSIQVPSLVEARVSVLAVSV